MKVTDPSQNSLSTSKSSRFRIGFVLLSVAIGLAVFYGWPGDKVRQVADNEKSQSKRSAASSGGRNERGADSSDSAAPSKPSLGSEETAEARATRRREALANRSRTPKSVVDLMASWSDQPPWPEGPRLYAEVETSSKKYINLRPDDYGVMPRIHTGPGELLEIKITFPESEPGEKIHVELPNGGSFSDSEVVGRIYDIEAGKSFSFSIFADDARGNCNVKMRHQGHTRSIPLWVGEPEENGS
jgi:hypothetical protein